MPLRFSSLMEHAIIGTIFTTLFLVYNYSLHRIEEGHVGVYFRVSSYIFVKNKSDFKYVSVLGRCFITLYKLTRLSHDDTIVNKL